MKNETREKLIKAGARAMVAKSYHGVGIQEILAEVEVPKGSFYHYFSSKEDFAVAIIEYYGAYLANRIQQRLSSEQMSPRNRLKQYFLEIRDYYAKTGYGQGCLVAKLATEVADSSPRMRTALKGEFDNWTKLFAVCIKQAQQAGEITPEHDADALAELIYTSWEGALIRMQVNHDLSSIENFIEYIFTFVIPERKGSAS